MVRVPWMPRQQALAEQSRTYATDANDCMESGDETGVQFYVRKSNNAARKSNKAARESRKKK